MNTYIIYNRSLKTYQMFQLRKCTILRKKYGNLEFHGCNMSQTSWDGGNKMLEKVTVTDNKQLEELGN